MPGDYCRAGLSTVSDVKITLKTVPGYKRRVRRPSRKMDRCPVCGQSVPLEVWHGEVYLAPHRLTARGLAVIGMKRRLGVPLR